MRQTLLLALAALSMISTAAHAATRRTADPAPSALPGTLHFGPDPVTGKFKRLHGKAVAPRTAGTRELENNARHDGTQKDHLSGMK